MILKATMKTTQKITVMKTTNIKGTIFFVIMSKRTNLATSIITTLSTRESTKSVQTYGVGFNVVGIEKLEKYNENRLKILN